MEPDHQIEPPHKPLLVDVVPSAMVMPGTNSYILLDEHKSSQKLLQAVRAGQSPHLFAVMSDPRIKEVPDKFCKVGVVAEAEANTENPRINLKGMFRAERIGLKKIGNHDGNLWVVTVKRIEDENHDDYFVQATLHVKADMIKIRDLLVGFIIRAKGFYEFDDRLMRTMVDAFDNTDWGDKDAIDNFIWATVTSVPDLLQKDKQPFLESVSLPERIKLCISKLKERLQLLEIQKQGFFKK